LVDILAPRLRVVIAGTIAAWDRVEAEHYYSRPGNQFWRLLHESGLTPERLEPEDDHLLPTYGIGLTDLVRTARSARGEPPHFDLATFTRTIDRIRPDVLAFVSKTAASSYARAAHERAPRAYGPLPWLVSGRAAFTLPGPSGANNGMPLPLRIALWRDLVDYLDVGG
jgi:TDG/mug DNA glycosylase family protein